MKQGAFDFGHYVPYFLVVLLVSLFLYLTIFYTFGEQEVTIHQRSLDLEDTFLINTMLRCFSDPETHAFSLSRFTDATLVLCTTKNIKVTYTFVGDETREPIVIGNKQLEQPDILRKEYVADPVSLGGVLTIAY
ncbi:MAG: hypothetical protein AABX72_03570 [Nanoarchaeota archaeon]